MRLTKRQLKRIIREEYSKLKRKGLIKETGRRATYGGSGIGRRFVPNKNVGPNPIEALCDDMMHCDAWYEYMYETGTKGSEIELVNDQDLMSYGFPPEVVEEMMNDKMEFEEYCEMDLDMRIGRCWDNFFAIMDRREGEGHL